VTIDGFRKLALALPESYESAHMDHPDFRVRKKVFATLAYPNASWAMVKLRPVQQAQFLASLPAIFVPVKGSWGVKGATNVRLRAATQATLWPALVAAWKNVAPAALLKRHVDLERPRRLTRVGRDREG
jgi:hypothetical protein